MDLLANKNIKLVPLEKRHLFISRKWVNNLKLAEKMMRYLPVSKNEQFSWYKNIRKDKAKMVLAIEKSLHHIGNIGLYDIDHVHRKAELWILIGENRFRHKGLGRQSIELLIKYSFDSLNLNKIYLYVDKENYSAIKLYKSLGFKKEGCFIKDRYIQGRYKDVLRLYILKRKKT